MCIGQRAVESAGGGAVVGWSWAITKMADRRRIMPARPDPVWNLFIDGAPDVYDIPTIGTLAKFPEKLLVTGFQSLVKRRFLQQLATSNYSEIDIVMVAASNEKSWQEWRNWQT